MTIGIGVLCSTKPGKYTPKPDALVMVSDTMGSTPTDSTDDLGKMYLDEDLGMYAVCADNVDIAGELFECARIEVAQIQRNRNHGAIWNALSRAAYLHRSEHFMSDVVRPNYAYQPDKLATEDHEHILNDWKAYDVGAQILVGVFDQDGRALLQVLAKYEGVSALVHTIAFPGYCAIGSGSYNANLILNQRRQHLGRAIRQSVYHAFEGRHLASNTPTVNEQIEMTIATKDQTYYLSDKAPNPSGSPISLPELRSMLKKYGLQSTDELGFSATLSVMKTSEGQR